MRHLKTEEWVKIFNAYDDFKNRKISKFEFEQISFSIRQNYWNKGSLKIMLRKRKMYNLNTNIQSKTGKASKKGKGVGRKKRKALDYTWIDTLKDDEKDAVIKYYYRIFSENNIDADIKNIKEIEKLSSNNKAKILLIARSTYYEKLKVKKIEKQKYIKHEEVIRQSFVDNKMRYGRRRLSKYLFLTYNIKVNPRTLGNYMKRLNLFTFVRRKKRQKEHKNTNVKFADLVQRDYNSKNNTIYATDVTYIPAPKDINQNHIYLSAIIDHKTKFVTYEISLNNDTELVLNNIKNTKFKDNFILHSDHGSAYSSIDYINKIKSLNGKISMSRIGNSLDNREIEYFFSILKSEIFPDFSI
ncbi:IS3 family transposase [Mycoplasmopsis cynos]|uniref:IS3 family transposase n=1 Tax=Mycoplasmopsis cynos TaxID=171284 RepID=UPI0024C99A17|nr:DDE-type integrase/transposase/recombinase [Mycoplasmopsis cynos]WAM08391.1 IS3 family transposase [Mycoplasmopsis cynos]